jgi:hypothetical protein
VCLQKALHNLTLALHLPKGMIAPNGLLLVVSPFYSLSVHGYG